ncbi:unnamed protein product [Adineta steineri]|uniref:Reverse transcriptase domain-containing protein n=1 Tax=Adineta steineri TaxID=433720 RepID=A0A819BYZ4_9BILA|nr:unnamed protein product [Adineta steineri]
MDRSEKWNQDPDGGFNKETRTLEPRQLYFAADLKSATTKFFNRSHEDQLLLNLSKDTSIIITKPDKGRGVVIMNRSDYIGKWGQILRNRSKFTLLTGDPTGTQQYRYIKPVGSISARLYGLPKVHKTNVPLRPIVSCIQSYNYRLGKFLVDIVKSIRNSTYSLKNSDAFIRCLKENSSLSIHKMISFNVESLFTNIPVNRTINIICEKLYWADLILNPIIPEYATKWTHFLYNGNYYDQCDGVSIGTSLAAIFAEVFMANFEEQYISPLLTNGSK